MNEPIKLYFMSRFFEIGAYILLTFGSTSILIQLLAAFVVCENILLEIHRFKSGLFSVFINIDISKIKKYMSLICFILMLAIIIIIDLRMNSYFMIALLCFSLTGHIECTIWDIIDSQPKE